jgi:DNA-binding NarL/FixJ family response regulator
VNHPTAVFSALARAPTIAAMAFESQRIVVVDDHPSFRSVLGQLLRARGHQVVAEVGDGRGAHEAVARVNPDAVLVDVQLGDESGFDVAWALTHRYPSLCVLLVSAGNAPEPSRVRECGAWGFVRKADLARADLSSLVSGSPRWGDARVRTTG